MKKIIVAAFTVITIFSACTVSRKTTFTSNASIKYLGGYEVPYNQLYKGTTIGGLSGIDYDYKSNQYYIISDDRSEINPARFYTAKINITQNGISDVEFVNVTNLLQPNGSTYPNRIKDPAHAPDPEALRYNPVTDQFVWTSEGERITGDKTILQDPAITIINKAGKFIDTFPLPVQMHMHATENGLRRNGVFEGLTFANNFKTMYVSVEEPLYEDGPRAALQDTATWTRIIKYDVKTHNLLAQYAYHLEPIAHPSVPINDFKINGIPDILSLGDNKLLVVERSFSSGRQACTIRVYVTDLTNASDIAAVSALQKQPPVQVASKKLLINMDNLGIYIDNIEGVTFGPDLPNGHKTLIFVSDNNFAKEQKTQFLLFEVM